MVTFYEFPREHWKHLRTTNPVESPFASVRLRTNAGKRYKRVQGATALIWRVLMVAEKTLSKTQCARITAPRLRRTTIPGWEADQERKDIHQEKVEAGRLISFTEPPSAPPARRQRLAAKPL